MTRFCEVGQSVRVRYLALLLCCSCAHRTLQTAETARSEWKTAATVERKQQETATKQTATKRTTRTVTRKPSGEVIDQTLIEELVELASQLSVVTEAGSASTAGSAEAAKVVKQESKPAPVGWWVRLRFWLLLVVVVALLGAVLVTRLKRAASKVL